MALEVKSVDLLGMPVAYACAVKAGPWVFLTGHEAFDWETGEVDASVSGPAGISRIRHASPEPPRSRLRAATDDEAAARVRHRSRACGQARSVLSQPACGRRLPPVPPREPPRIHPAEHLGGDGTAVWWRLDDLDLPDPGHAGS